MKFSEYLIEATKKGQIEDAPKDEYKKQVMEECLARYSKLIKAGLFTDGVEIHFTADLSKGNVDVGEKRAYIATLNPDIISKVEPPKERTEPSAASITKKQTLVDEMARLGVKSSIDKKYLDRLISSQKEPWIPNISFYKLVTLDWQTKQAPEDQKKRTGPPTNWRSVKLNTIEESKIKKVTITDEMIKNAKEKLVSE